MRRLVMAALVVTLAGCGVPWVSYPADGASTKATANPEALYAATIRVFVKRGFGVVSRDPVARVVETDYVRWPDTVGGGGSVVHVAYRVIVDGDSTIHFFTSCKRAFGQDCPAGQRPKGVDAVEQELLSAILAESKNL